ncbi:MAG TPA: peroxidase family protein, partial [Streptosporangiaceae bacterium]|nr:peroxidase family protein [Streptosporangiaceae bacterium]
AVGSAFGRNLRPDLRPDLFDEPSPVTVSQQLLHREQFLPARSLNLLAAAWIQFQVHDWVSHARYPLGQADVRVPLPAGMQWSNTPGGPRDIPGRQPVLAVVPAPGPPRAAQPRGAPPRTAEPEPVRQRGPGGPAAGQAGAAHPAR